MIGPGRRPGRAGDAVTGGAASTATRTALVAAAAAALAQYGPAALGVNGLPRRLAPRWAGVGRPDHIALTFDDGPHPDGTAAVLGVLARHHVTATFFLVADRAGEHAALVRRAVAEGHEIALHGWDHRPLPSHHPLRSRRDLAAAREVVRSLSGAAPRWYRPPYGVATGSALLAAVRLGMRPTWWTAWGRDWSPRAGGDSVADRVLRDLRPGGTVLLHDSDRFAAPGSWRSTVAALPAILRAAGELGCAVGPLGEHW